METLLRIKFLNKDIIYFFIIFVLIIACVSIFERGKDIPGDFKKLQIGDVEIQAEISDTILKRVQGLSGRDFLPENQGMLFVYDHEDYFAFWMKDMNFSLDFIWINNGKVVNITQNVKPEDYQPPKNLKPTQKVSMILEVNAGFVEKNGIQVGDNVKLKNGK